MIRPIRNGGFGGLATHKGIATPLNSKYRLPGESIEILAFDDDGTMLSRKESSRIWLGNRGDEGAGPLMKRCKAVNYSCDGNRVAVSYW